MAGFRVGDRWPPGAYLLKLVASGAERYVPLTVTDPSSHDPLVVMDAVTTWQAYNDWGGRNLYWGPFMESGTRSRVVSFDRPYARGDGASDFLHGELPLISLLEQAGLDATYWTDIDLHQHPELLLRHRALLSLGHDEYWSTAMRHGATVARDHGVNLAFLGANAVFRHIRLQASPLGPDREEVNYKPASARADPAWRTNRREVTTDWREPPLHQPESSLLGELYECNPTRADGVVVQPGSWLLAGTGLGTGSRLPNLVGPEYDRAMPSFPTPRGVELVLHSPLRCRFHSSFSDVTYYTTASGAGVVDTRHRHLELDLPDRRGLRRRAQQRHNLCRRAPHHHEPAARVRRGPSGPSAPLPAQPQPLRHAAERSVSTTRARHGDRPAQLAGHDPLHPAAPPPACRSHVVQAPIGRVRRLALAI